MRIELEMLAKPGARVGAALAVFMIALAIYGLWSQRSKADDDLKAGLSLMNPGVVFNEEVKKTLRLPKHISARGEAVEFLLLRAVDRDARYYAAFLFLGEYLAKKDCMRAREYLDSYLSKATERPSEPRALRLAEALEDCAQESGVPAE